MTLAAWIWLMAHPLLPSPQWIHASDLIERWGWVINYVVIR